MKIPLTLTSLLLLVSCQETYKVGFEEESCVREISRSYASEKDALGSYYRLDKIDYEKKKPQIVVSVWHNNSWYYQGAKKINYFEGSDLFKYKKAKCPDGSGAKSLEDRLRKMNI